MQTWVNKADKPAYGKHPPPPRVLFPGDRLPWGLTPSEQNPLSHSELCKPSGRCYSRKKWSAEMGTFWFEREKILHSHPLNTHTHTHTQDNCCSHIISSSFALNRARLSYPFAQPQWRRPRAGLELVYREKRYETKLPGGGEAEEWREGRIETGNQEQTELSSWNYVNCFWEGRGNTILVDTHS